jgi:molybdate transport system substrate-binding protein
VRPLPRFLLASAAGVLLAAVSALAQTAGTSAGREDAASLSWQQDADTDTTQRGLEFTVPPVDLLADFHGDLNNPKLVLYVGGNYFFAMAPLVQAFEAAHPEYKGRIYWETIPPGLLAKQMQAGGRITVGNMTWAARPDAYFAGLAAVKNLISGGLLTGPAVPYVTNTLAIMVPKGNPAHIANLADLAKPGVRVAMPNPAFEGIARQVKAALTKAGGNALATAVYETKVKDGTTVLTHIHHRQTPLFLMQGIAEAGVTWQSEAIYQEQAGHPIEHVAIPPADNAVGIYAGAEVTGAAHPDAAKAWLDFIRSPVALGIFERYGFKPYAG